MSGSGSTPAQAVALREVLATDIPEFFRQQIDPIACELAAYPPREPERFDTNWRASIADPEIVARTIVVDGAVAGHLIAWPADGRRLVGYWLDRKLWDHGIMTSALAEFLPLVSQRPLFAHVAEHNPASASLLGRAGFVEQEHVIAEDGVPEIIFRLD